MFYRQFLLFIIFFQFSNSIFAQDDIESDILFQKIQELEIEIANLRNELESLNYLIQKLIDESSREVANDESNDIENIADNNGIRFKGLDDKKSKEEIYSLAISNLEKQNLEEAYISFKFFVENFVDDSKSPLSLFWLAEISLINNDLENSKNYFLQLINDYPDHYRIPLAHKKIGDIYLKNNEINIAKERYQFVAREFPNSSASSQALQLLKNME